MNQDKVTMAKSEVMRMINVLKAMDVRGFESMYRLVATVEFLEGVLTEQAQQTPPQQGRPPRPKPAPPVDHEFEPLPMTNPQQN